MKEPRSKDELLKCIRITHKRLETTLAKVPSDSMLLAGVEGEWSVKDLLAHIAAWERRMVVWLEQAREGHEVSMLPPGMTWDDLDSWNAQTYREHADDPLDAVLQESEAAFQAAFQTVSDTGTYELMYPGRFEWRKGSPLWKMVAANMYWHYDEHRETIERWLAARQKED